MLDLGNTVSSRLVIGDYIIGNRIGKGGFGEVYKAEHRYLGDQDCIKIIRPDYQSEELKNYLWREANVLNKLNNDHIVHLKNLTIENDQIYMIMAYVDGGDLAAFLKKSAGLLAIEEVDHILDQIADGLHYAHQQHIIHRDLKPQNILRYQDGRIVIADFGLAQVLDTALTQSLQSNRGNAGTPHYMAPEQFEGRSGYTSDLYSLGVIIYQLLTNCLPFVGDQAQAEEGHRHKNPPPLRDFNPEITSDIEQVVLKMLAKRPEDRYQSAIEFRRAFGNALTKKTIKTRVSPETIEGLLHLFPDDQVVILEPGEYKGPFNIDKRLHLIGTGSFTRLSTVDEPVLSLTVSGICMENMLIQRTSEKNDEKVIEAASGVTYTLRHVTLLGGSTEGAHWEDAEWQLPINGIDFGHIPIESQQTRSVPIEVKAWCDVETDLSSLRVFPFRLSPGTHNLSLQYNACEQLPGTTLNGSVILRSETETKTISVTGQIEQSALPITSSGATSFPYMEWDYQIQDKAAQALLNELGDDEEKQLTRQRDRENPQWRREITRRSSSLLARLFGRTPFCWYVRRVKGDQDDLEVETLELTLATDSTPLPPSLANNQRTLRLRGTIHQEGLGKFKISTVVPLKTELGFANRVSLPVWIRLAPSLPDYAGIPQHFLEQLQTLLINQTPALDGDQLQGWEELLQFYSNLYKRKQYWIAYNRHNYREGATKVTFFLDKAEARDSEQELLSYEEFQTRARNSRKEKLKIFTDLPEITNNRRKRDAGEIIGRVEQVQADNATLTLNLDPNLLTRSRNTYDLPPSGYLHFDAWGDMSQTNRQQDAITDLRQGKTKNALLSDFFFDARKARFAPVIKHLEPADLLSGTCNSAQIAAIEAAIAVPDLLLIQGPPGTGKTTVIAEICYQIARRGGRTLVASQSNLAVDNALGRIIHHPSIRALRKGTPDSVEDEGRDFTEERVIDTWLNNTVRDCQTKLEQRQHHIAQFKTLLSEAPRFAQYFASERAWEDERTALQRKLASATQEIRDLESAILQGNKEIEKNAPVQAVFSAIVNETVDWRRPDLNHLLRDIFLYMTETGDKQQFVMHIDECVQISRQLGLTPPVEGHMLATVAWLQEAIRTSSRTWAISRDYLSQAEEVLNELNSIEQQQQQVATTLQAKTATMQNLDTLINRLESTLRSQPAFSPALEEALTALKILPNTGDGSILFALKQFMNEEYSKQRVRPDLSTNLQLEQIFSSVIVTAVQQNTSTTFSGIWYSLQRKIQQRLQQFIQERKILNLMHNQYEIQVRVSASLSANARFVEDVAQEMFSAVHRQLSEEQQAIMDAHVVSLEEIRQLESKRQQVQATSENDSMQLTYLTNERVDALHRLIDTFQALSTRPDLSDELQRLTIHQLHTQTFSQVFMQEYQTAYQRWSSESKLLEELVTKLWNQVKAANTDIQSQLASTHTALEQQQQRLCVVQKEQETLEMALQQCPSMLLQEREWWRSFWETIPEAIRSMAPPEGIFALSFLEAVQRQFVTWEAEFKKEDTFAQHYDGLIADWITSLQNISELERERLRDVYIKNANVIGITCGQARQSSPKDFRAFSTFDVVIIDEVSKATPPELLLPALKGKKLILIGDQHQLPPMIEDKTLEQMAEDTGQDPATFHYLNQPYFADRYNEAPDEIKRMLYIQYRMHPDIMAAINQFYERPLECGLNQPDIERDHGLESSLVRKQTHLIWVKTPLISSSEYNRNAQRVTAVNKATGREVFSYKSQSNNFGEERVGTSYINKREIEIIKKICEELQQIWKPKQIAGAAPKEIGVITFYSAQASELEKSLGTARRSKSSQFDALNIRVGSVDRFQGMEREIIIVSMVRNNYQSDIGFARKDERINVAFSRAQQLLIIVGCHDLFCNTSRRGNAAERYSNVSKIVRHRGDFIDVS